MVNISPALRAADPSFATLIDAVNTMQQIVDLQKETIASLSEAVKCWQNVAAMREAENATLRARLAAATPRAA